MSITWKLEDHVCRSCGGRILKSVSGAGMTPGGNPIYRCADCGRGGSFFGENEICWCGFSYRQQNLNPYKCLSFRILEEHPELLPAFQACGCEPGRSEVGIVLETDYRALMEKGT